MTVTRKLALIKRLNELRQQHDLPPYDPNKLTMTTEEIDKLIDHLENGVHPDKAKPVTQTKKEIMADALAKLNVLRKRAKEKPLSKWTLGYERLKDAIDLIQLDLKERAQQNATKVPTKVAKGSTTQRKNTELHKNVIREDMVKMRKRQEQQQRIERKDKAKKIALWAGFAASNVLLYLEAQTPDSAVLAGEPLKAAIKAFLEARAVALPQIRRGRTKSPLRAFLEAESKRLDVPEKALSRWLEANPSEQRLKLLSKSQEKRLRSFMKSRPKLAQKKASKPRTTDGVTPQTIAASMGLDAKAVRMRLRKLEPKIKPAWRIAGERWGFKTEHSADIIKLIKGE